MLQLYGPSITQLRAAIHKVRNDPTNSLAEYSSPKMPSAIFEGTSGN